MSAPLALRTARWQLPHNQSIRFVRKISVLRLTLNLVGCQRRVPAQNHGDFSLEVIRGLVCFDGERDRMRELLP